MEGIVNDEKIYEFISNYPKGRWTRILKALSKYGLKNLERYTGRTLFELSIPQIERIAQVDPKLRAYDMPKQMSRKEIPKQKSESEEMHGKRPPKPPRVPRVSRGEIEMEKENQSRNIREEIRKEERPVIMNIQSRTPIAHGKYKEGGSARGTSLPPTQNHHKSGSQTERIKVDTTWRKGDTNDFNKYRLTHRGKEWETGGLEKIIYPEWWRTLAPSPSPSPPRKPIQHSKRKSSTSHRHREGEPPQHKTQSHITHQPSPKPRRDINHIPIQMVYDTRDFGGKKPLKEISHVPKKVIGRTEAMKERKVPKYEYPLKREGIGYRGSLEREEEGGDMNIDPDYPITGRGTSRDWRRDEDMRLAHTMKNNKKGVGEKRGMGRSRVRKPKYLENIESRIKPYIQEDKDRKKRSRRETERQKKEEESEMKERIERIREVDKEMEARREERRALQLLGRDSHSRGDVGRGSTELMGGISSRMGSMGISQNTYSGRSLKNAIYSSGGTSPITTEWADDPQPTIRAPSTYDITNKYPIPTSQYHISNNQYQLPNTQYQLPTTKYEVNSKYESKYELPGRGRGNMLEIAEGYLNNSIINQFSTSTSREKESVGGIGRISTPKSMETPYEVEMGEGETSRMGETSKTSMVSKTSQTSTESEKKEDPPLTYRYPLLSPGDAGTRTTYSSRRYIPQGASSAEEMGTEIIEEIKSSRDIVLRGPNRDAQRNDLFSLAARETYTFRTEDSLMATGLLRPGPASIPGNPLGERVSLNIPPMTARDQPIQDYDTIINIERPQTVDLHPHRDPILYYIPNRDNNSNPTRPRGNYDLLQLGEEKNKKLGAETERKFTHREEAYFGYGDKGKIGTDRPMQSIDSQLTHYNYYPDLHYHI